jgi:hypothetical protein
MSGALIVVNCANVREAQRRLEMSSNGRKYLPHGADFALGLLPVLEDLEREGLFKWSQLAKCLNDRGLVTSAGKRWGPVTVNRLLGRLGEVIRVSAWAEAS